MQPVLHMPRPRETFTTVKDGNTHTHAHVCMCAHTYTQARKQSRHVRFLYDHLPLQLGLQDEIQHAQLNLNFRLEKNKPTFYRSMSQLLHKIHLH